MLRALARSDAAYDGVFVTAVRTTGIFCRPSCRARKPRAENVEFFATTEEALASGFRPCLRCRPLTRAGAPPEWIRGLLEAVARDPARRWTGADLRRRGLNPDRVRRWFLDNHGMTFQAHRRARILGLAAEELKGGTPVLPTALDHGYESLSGFVEAFRRNFGATPSGAPAVSLITVTRVLTPLGPLVAGVSDRGLCLLEFADRRMLETQLGRLTRRLRASVVPGEHEVLDDAARELDAYFKGSLRAFTVPLDARGTPFQEAVWTALRKVPYGETVSYAELARRIRRPSAVRAVARANGDNRLGIVIPCHRVIGADGALTGYGGGLWRKQRLLDLEGAGCRPFLPEGF
jgi:AraC family transcriptional regulator of adaptative response/methylated-DNA-[protein]-cysteine methyltransferase